MSDGKDGLALFTKGIFEYEAYEDDNRTVALTLLRGCRIKQPIGEGMLNILPDPGAQCLGIQKYEYAICVHEGNFEEGGILQKAAEYEVPVRTAMSGRGKGDLRHEYTVFRLNNRSVSVSCVKNAEDRDGFIIRLFNPLEVSQEAALQFGCAIKQAMLCRMDETRICDLSLSGSQIKFIIDRKKIMTFRIVLESC